MDLFHWFIYHGYALNPDSSYKNVEALKGTLAKYSSKATMRQGENGCPSELATKFALSNHPWTLSPKDIPICDAPVLIAEKGLLMP